MKKILLITTLAFLAFSLQAQDYFGAIKKDVAKFNSAIVSQDYDTYIQYLNPDILEKAGGKEVMIQVEKDKAVANASVGFKTESIVPVKMSEIVNAGAELHTIVTQEEVIRVADSKFKRKAFYLAATRDGGETWTFVDLEPYTVDAIKLYIPDYNSALKFPAAEPAEIIKE